MGLGRMPEARTVPGPWLWHPHGVGAEGQQISGLTPFFPSSRAQPSLHPLRPPLPGLWAEGNVPLSLATPGAVQALPLPPACGRIPLEALSQCPAAFPAPTLLFPLSALFIPGKFGCQSPAAAAAAVPQQPWPVLFLISVPMILSLHPLPTPRCCWCPYPVFCYCCTRDQLLFALHL